MENFEPKKLNITNINGGKKFINGVDPVNAEEINAIIEGVAYNESKILKVENQNELLETGLKELGDDFAEEQEKTNNAFNQVYTDITNGDDSIALQVENLSLDVEDNTAEIGRINAILSNYTDKDILAVAEGVENNEPFRQTGGVELSLVEIKENSETIVTMIEGNTEIMNDDSFAHSKISGIKSVGKNLVNIDSFVNDVFVKNDDGTYTITKSGNNRFSAKIAWILPKNTIFTPSTEIISIYDPTANGGNGGYVDNSSNYLGVEYVYDNGEVGISTGFNIKKGYSTIAARKAHQQIVSLQLYLSSGTPDGFAITIKNLMFSFGYDALPFEPYYESVMSLPEQVELSKYDYIKNNEIHKYGKEIVFNGSENWVFSGNSMSVKLPQDFANEQRFLCSGARDYKVQVLAENNAKILKVQNLDEGITDLWEENFKSELSSENLRIFYSSNTLKKTKIEFNNKYKVFNKGYEIMQLQGTLDVYIDQLTNPIPTITQDYLIVVRGNKQ